MSEPAPASTVDADNDPANYPQFSQGDPEGSEDRPPAEIAGETDPANDPAKFPQFFQDKSDLTLLTEGAEALTSGAVKGVTEGSGIFAGGASGARLGFMATSGIPLLGARAVGVTIGAGIGGTLGWLAAKEAQKGVADVNMPSGAPLIYKSLDAVPPHLRSSFIFGENIGQGVPFIGTSVTAAKMGLRTLSNSFVGRLFNHYMDMAARKTKLFVLGETIGVAGSATGGAIAEEARPGSLGARVTGEVVGGVVAPGRGWVHAASWLGTKMTGLRQSFRKSDRMTAAARVIQDIFETSGGDIVLAARLLREAEPLEGATAAQQTGLPEFIALENALRERSRQFGDEAAEQAAATMEAFAAVIRVLRGDGSPDALVRAAEVEHAYYRTLLTDRMDAFNDAAVKAAGNIAEDTPLARSALSVDIQRMASDTLADAREVETVLWGAVPSDIEATAEGIFKTFQSILALRLPRSPVPKIITDTLKDLEAAGGRTDIGFLKLFRSEMLRNLREAAASPERRSEVMFYGRLAEAALDDMDVVLKGENAAVMRTLGIATEAYDKARRFTAEIHSVFSSGFGGQTLAESGQGLRIAPEVLMSRVFAGGREATALRMVELEEATRFLPTRNYGGEEAVKRAEVMVESQERFLAIVAEEAAGGGETVRAKSIQNFITKNPEMMQRFPEVKKRLQEAAKTREAADDFVKSMAGEERALIDRTIFGRLAGGGRSVFESPVDLVSSILSGRKPLEDMAKLADLARKGGGDTGLAQRAVSGLQHTIYDHALREASHGGTLDFARFRQILFDPINPGLPSVVDVMVNSGILQADNVAALVKILDRADKVVKASAGGAVAQFDTNVDDLTRMVARGVGSQIATGIAKKITGGTATGPSLVIAAGGASLSEKVIARIPGKKIVNILIEATKDRQLMSVLLAKPVGQAKTIEHVLKLDSILAKLGAFTARVSTIGVEPTAIGGVANIPKIIEQKTEQ